MSIPQGKRCGECGKVFYRRKAESNFGFTQRKHCSERCETAQIRNSPWSGLWDAFTKGGKF